MFCDDLEGWDRGDGRKAEEGGDICIHIADSHHFIEENATI